MGVVPACLRVNLTNPPNMHPSDGGIPHEKQTPTIGAVSRASVAVLNRGGLFGPPFSFRAGQEMFHEFRIRKSDKFANRKILIIHTPQFLRPHLERRHSGGNVVCDFTLRTIQSEISRIVGAYPSYGFRKIRTI